VLTSKDDNAKNNGWIYSLHNEAYLDVFHNPFRVSVITYTSGNPKLANQNESGYVTSKNMTNWIPRDNMSWWADGMSNQLCFAEKQIPSWALTDSHLPEFGIAWNGGYLYANGGWETSNVGRYVSTNANLIAQNPGIAGTANQSKDLTQYDGGSAYALGSSHPNSLSVLLGDGSVHSITKSALPSVLTALTKVDDGEVVSLP
jgi:hypothetical protein